MKPTERFPVGIIRTSTIMWHDTDGDKPGQGEQVLTVDTGGDHNILFWRDDADAWDSPGFGFIDKDAVIAWARLPVYE